MNDVFDRLTGDLGDRVNQSFGFGRAALAIRHEHALVGDDEHVGGGELLRTGVEVFVRVDVL